nr:MAG TPA: hypothetical protein [Caudoviricetes sp.]
MIVMPIIFAIAFFLLMMGTVYGGSDDDFDY